MEWMEWTDPYNPFNSMKALAWQERLDRFWNPFKHGNWRRGPVTVNIELTNRCQQACPWCFTEPFRKRHPVDLPQWSWRDVAKAWREWGVKGTVLCGGGEPQLHPSFSDALRAFFEEDLETGVVTGAPWRAGLIPVSWVGVSVDAGTQATWERMGKVGDLEKLLDSFEILRDVAGGTSVTYKFLAWRSEEDPEGNVKDIPQAARLAKKHGFKAIHIRPAFGTWPIVDWDQLVLEARAEEDQDFRVYAPTHKVPPMRGRTQYRFTHCRTTPLLLNICADSGLYLCQDHRGEWAYELANLHTCSWEAFIKEVWGSPMHLERLRRIDPKACGRCTFSPYNELYEKLPQMTPEFI